MTAPLVTQRTELGRVYVRGAHLQADVQELITAASLSWSTTEVTQMSLTVEDPGFQLWHSGLFTIDTTVTYRPTGFDEDLRLRIAAFDLGGGSSGRGGFTLRARSEIAWLLKRRTGPMVMSNTSASGFVEAEARAVGARVVAQPTVTRAQVARQVPEPDSPDRGAEVPSSWTTFKRLAEEEKFLVYEFAGTIYFGKPSWLMANLGGALNVGWGTASEEWNLMKCPTISVSEDAETPVSISGLEVRPHRMRETAPGRRLTFHGIQPFAGTYLTTSVTLPLMGTGNLQIGCETPYDASVPPPNSALGQKAVIVDTANIAGDPIVAPIGAPAEAVPPAETVPGGRTGAAFVAIALSQASGRFAYGQETTGQPDSLPPDFDVAELIQWALGRLGIKYPRNVYDQVNAGKTIPVSEALQMRGTLLRLDKKIAISLGDGRTLEFREGRGVGLFPASEVDWEKASRIKELQY